MDYADTLEVLDLSGNNLSVLPDDFARFKKLKILFLSNNRFETLPSVLESCPALSMIGFRNNRMKYVPENSLPATTRWLILTDNLISHLPESIGELKDLQKLMLAGNQLTQLPESMAGCHNLQLLRISANELSGLPDWLLKLPMLAWLAFASNPFCAANNFSRAGLPEISWAEIEQQSVLGQGASGVIHEASWKSLPPANCSSGAAIVVKKYKGRLTSDGYSQDELNACMAAGSHRNLVPAIAQVNDDRRAGLIMQKIEGHYKNLGKPPSLSSCTRDEFESDFRVCPSQVLKIITQVTDTIIHLAGKNICHGDLYAHNILISPDADILLTDFGAASSYASLPDMQSHAIQKFEVRAVGCLLEDLLDHCVDLDSPLAAGLACIKNQCLNKTVAMRPTFTTLYSSLTELASKSTGHALSGAA